MFCAISCTFRTSCIKGTNFTNPMHITRPGMEYIPLLGGVRWNGGTLQVVGEQFAPHKFHDSRVSITQYAYHCCFNLGVGWPGNLYISKLCDKDWASMQDPWLARPSTIRLNTDKPFLTYFRGKLFVERFLDFELGLCFRPVIHPFQLMPSNGQVYV